MASQLVLSQATAAVIQDTRNEKKDGTFPLKLRIIFERRTVYFSVGISLSEVEYKQLSAPRIRDERMRNFKYTINEIERRASEVIDKLHGHFSFNLFKEQYFGNRIKGDSGNVYRAFNEYIEILIKNGQISTATGYRCSLHALKEFRKQLIFEDLNAEFLKAFDRFLKARGNSDTTVSMYMRNLRTLYNRAIDNGLISREFYPFTKNRYQIPASRNTKKALTMSELMAIYTYKSVEGSAEDRAKDIWLFSYLCNGINVKDICRLTYSCINGDKITIVRAKTERTARGNQQAIEMFPEQKAFEIINKYGNQDKSPSSFIFPFLPSNPSPEIERKCVQNVTKTINKYMKAIGKSLKIKLPLTTYVARHTFSTVLKRNNVPTEMIAESLGHRDIKTTRNYLDSFEDESKRSLSKYLTDFSTQENLEKVAEPATSNFWQSIDMVS
jgi:integrase/recombinase XerD